MWKKSSYDLTSLFLGGVQEAHRQDVVETDQGHRGSHVEKETEAHQDLREDLVDLGQIHQQ